MVVVNGNYRHYELDNGLVVALQNTPTQTIVAKLRVNYGSSHERKGEEGMAHFLEHCLVTGGSEKFDPLIADQIRTSFGYTNANTNIGRIFSIGQMLSEDLEPWLEYISDHAFKPRFDQERFDGERERVLREISDERSHPAYLDHVKLKRLFYRGHPKGISVLGKSEVVKDANLEKLASFHRRGYYPNNMDLIIVGGLPENVDEMIKEYFGSFPSGKSTRREFPKLKPLEEKIVLHSPAPEMINKENPDESSAIMDIRYVGPIDGHEDEYAVRVMNRVLGFGTNSLLFQNVSLRKGLAYSINTYGDGFYNAGEIGINASVHAGKIEEVLEYTFGEFERMKTQEVDEKTIDRIKRTIKYGFAKTFETNEGHVEAIEVELNEGITLNHVLEEFEGVTSNRVMEVANRYLPDREDGKYVLYIRDPLKK